MKLWVTINEPMQIIEGYQQAMYAPALNLDSPTNYIVVHNIVRAHGRIYRLYDGKYRSKQKGRNLRSHHQFEKYSSLIR